MKADDVKLTVRINKEIARKMAYIAEYYGRSMNGQIYWLAKQEIARFEKEIGKIEETELEE